MMSERATAGSTSNDGGIVETVIGSWTTLSLQHTGTTTVYADPSAQAFAPLFTTSVPPTGTTILTTGDAISTNPTTSNTPSTPSSIPPSSGLSTRAKAGIGVGVTFGVVLLIAVLVFVFFLGRKTARKNSNPTEATMESKAELHAISRPHELEGEMSLTSEEREELERRRRAVELQGKTLIKPLPLTGEEIVSERAELVGLRNLSHNGSRAELG
ncbi:hypothetical protein B0J14DRAFT_316590 [Halenospora varia]|nr:hypothetical protein B0J14DRAFT_316590 [Halenospora varia]